MSDTAKDIEAVQLWIENSADELADYAEMAKCDPASIQENSANALEALARIKAELARQKPVMEAVDAVRPLLDWHFGEKFKVLADAHDAAKGEG